MFETDEEYRRALIDAFDKEAQAGVDLNRGIEAYEQARREDRLCMDDLRTLERLKIAQQKAREQRATCVWDYLEHKTRQLKAQPAPVR